MKKIKKNSKSKPPALLFYVNDWLTDPGLQQCSMEAQGMWIKLMCHMHNSDQYGFLIVSGTILDKKGIKKLFNCTPKKFQKAFQALIKFGILKQDERGAYHCTRMVKDKELSEIRKKSGRKGGNPNLVNQNSSKIFLKDNQSDNQNPTPSSSSSISSSISLKKDNKEDNKYSQRMTIPFQEFFDLYDKRVGNKEKMQKKWDDLSMKIKIMIMEFIPRYKESIPNKQYRKNPETFLNNKGWEDELINYRSINNENKNNQPGIPTTTKDHARTIQEYRNEKMGINSAS